MFIAALFTIAKIWKQPRCILKNEWIKEMWQIHTLKYHAEIKKNAILPFEIIMMDLEGILLSEISQSEKVNTANLTYMWNIKQTNKLKEK